MINNRISEIDGLRGIAILLVISFHYVNNQLTEVSTTVGRFLYKITSFGWTGVDLFFVISGFLIGGILLRSNKSRSSLQSFFIRRFLRIIPNYYLILIVFGIIFNVKSLEGSIFLTSNQSIPFWSYFLMVHNFYMAALENMGNPALSVTWSIGIEEQFYLILPFLLILVPERFIPKMLFFFILLANIMRLNYSSWIPPYVLLPCRADSIALGVLLAFIHHKHTLHRWLERYEKHLKVLLGFSLLLMAFLFLSFQDLGVTKHTLIAVVFTIVFAFAMGKETGIVKKILSFPLLTYIGKISYSLYLTHYFILGLAHYLCSGKPHIGIENIEDIYISITALLVSISLSIVIFKYLETPIVEYGKRFKY